MRGAIDLGRLGPRWFELLATEQQLALVAQWGGEKSTGYILTHSAKARIEELK